MNSVQSGRRRTAGLVSLVLLSACASLSGCAWLPSDGPSTSAVSRQQQRGEAERYRLIDISTASLVAEAQRPQVGFAEHFGVAEQAPPALIGVGDGLSVEIWEAGSNPLYAGRPSSGAAAEAAVGTRATTLSEQTVGADGSITLPFVGRVRVVGLSPQQVEQELRESLKGKAAQPQAVVHRRNASGAVTVAGDVAAGSRVPLSVRGERLLDVLAAAGGVRAPSYETRIQLTRGQDSFSMPLLRVLQDPSQNIYLQPGDLLVATRQPQSFTAFGATGRTAQIEFGAERISLIEAVAKTGGLLDQRADPRGVYLLRYEPRTLIEPPRAAPSADHQDEVRVIYRLDLAQAESYFLAQRFPMRDRDILYVSSAPANELRKFLELLGLISQPVIQGAVVHGALK